MIALDVSRNGRLLFRAGGFPDGILSVNLMRGSHIGDPPKWGVDVEVLAVTDDGAVEWTHEPLFPGDEVTCRVVEADEGDPPKLRRSDSEFAMLGEVKSLLMARTVYAGLKKRILEMEKKWGDRL